MNTDSIVRSVRILGADMEKHLGKVYFISDNAALFEEMKQKIFDAKHQTDYIRPLSPVLVRDLDGLGDPVLAEVVEESGATLVGAYPDTGVGATVFLLEKVAEKDVLAEADDFAFLIAKEERDALSTMLQNLAVNDPVTCRDFLKKVAQEPVGAVRGHNAPKRDPRFEEYKGHYVDNMKIMRDPGSSAAERARAQKEIVAVNNGMSHSSLSYLQTIIAIEGRAPTDEEYRRFLYPEESSFDVHVVPFRKTVSKRGEDERYRVTIRGGENAINLRFPLSASNALYTALLFDARYIGSERIELSRIEKLFIGVYRTLYPCDYSEAKDLYDKMFQREVPSKEDPTKMEWRQGRAKDFIRAIVLTVDNTIIGLDNPQPYLYSDGGRLHISKEKIHFPDGFREEVIRMQNPKEMARYK